MYLVHKISLIKLSCVICTMYTWSFSVFWVLLICLRLSLMMVLHSLVLHPASFYAFLAEEPGLLASVQYEVLFMGLRSSNMQMLFPPGQKPIFSLDYDWRQQCVFWVCLQEESIKYFLHGEKGNIKTLVKGLKSDSN